MDKIILWCCLLLVPLNHSFFIRSRDLRRILNFFPTPSKAALPVYRRPLHHRYHHQYQHDDHNHRHYYNEDNHYHHQEDEIKPEPIKEDFYDDEDYDYHYDRNDNFPNNRRKHHKKPEHNLKKQQLHHVYCEHDQSRQPIKKYKSKNKKPAKVVYQKQYQQDYEDNDEDYEEDPIVDHRKNRKIIGNRRPFNFKQDYVAGVLDTIPKIKDTDLSQEYFEHVKFNNPFLGTFTDNYGDIKTQTQLISQPFVFFDNL